MSDETVLELAGIGTPSYTLRGATQTLDPISAAADLRRSVNGTLRNLAHTQFQKYQSKITCADVGAPAFDGIWPGALVTVSCIAELSYPHGGSAQRTAVSGSEIEEGGFTRYRPQLDMVVTAFTLQKDEAGAVIGWELDLEEQ